MAKPTKPAFSPSVRTRRAYFDCRFGQLHVRTAFPGTGGFDEGVTLFCLHPREKSSHIFDRFLPEIADDRSVYAPDLPGCGESDGAPTMSHEEAGRAILDLAMDLRLREIDLLGFGFGAAVALSLAAARSDLVRRLVLLAPPGERFSKVQQESLVLRIHSRISDDAQWVKGILPRARFLDLGEYDADMFEAAPRTVARQIGAFLREKGSPPPHT